MRIGLLTSGGDAPGMNACIRAVVRTALPRGHQVVGIRRGYKGLLDEDFYYSFHLKDHQMHLRSVLEHHPSRGHDPAYQPLRAVQDGGRSAAPRRRFCDEMGSTVWSQSAATARSGDASTWPATGMASVVGCPGTIDNDLSGTDVSIGFTSAVSTAAHAVDKLRDTADATERLFLVEVMGRNSGQIAMHTALATGADAALIPEVPVPGR